MNQKFMISDDGNLYDTTIANWPAHPRRANYRRTHVNIESSHDLLATLRGGAYAWPGGYQMYFITSDGGALSFQTVRDELRSILESIKQRAADGWQVIGCEINYEDTDLRDDHTGEEIPAAYDD